MPYPARIAYRPRSSILAILVLGSLLLAACLPSVAQIGVATPTQRAPVSLTIVVDGETRTIAISAATVAEALAEAGIDLAPADEIDPPLDSTIPQTASNFVITVARITETAELIPESIPFERRIVRSAEISPDEPPRILQTGAPGLQEVSVRIVFRDGLEIERWPTATTVIDPPVDEIVMVGVGSSSEAMPIAGRLAYIDDGRAVVLEGATDAPRQLAVEGPLDGRVFQLSPDGGYLLYTVGSADEESANRFRNELWVIPTAEGGEPAALQIENVLWAGWDPAALEPRRIAYTTARSVSLPPGWEANNDLWLLELTFDADQPAPVRLVETYPATYGWWGGNYAWSPDGARLAYAFADEVGLIDLSQATLDETGPELPEPPRSVLHTFTAYDTAADWAWIPALSWSADGRYLAFTNHAAEEQFDLRLADTTAAQPDVLVEGAGIWAAAQWSPPGALPQLASLRAVDPAAGEDGSYALWLADEDGGNERRVFPPAGESGRFARTNQSIAWGPDGDAIAFIFEDALHVLDPATGEVFRAGLDDTISSHPTWAPYGPTTDR